MTTPCAVFLVQWWLQEPEGLEISCTFGQVRGTVLLSPQHWPNWSTDLILEWKINSNYPKMPSIVFTSLSKSSSNPSVKFTFPWFFFNTGIQEINKARVSLLQHAHNMTSSYCIYPLQQKALNKQDTEPTMAMRATITQIHSRKHRLKPSSHQPLFGNTSMPCGGWS